MRFPWGDGGMGVASLPLFLALSLEQGAARCRTSGSGARPSAQAVLDFRRCGFQPRPEKVRHGNARLQRTTFFAWQGPGWGEPSPASRWRRESGNRRKPSGTARSESSPHHNTTGNRAEPQLSFSEVTRRTSSRVVMPARTLRQPSMRRVCMPCATAYSLISPEVLRSTTIWRISSVTVRIS